MNVTLSQIVINYSSKLINKAQDDDERIISL